MSQSNDKSAELLNDIATLLNQPAGRRLFLVLLEKSNILGHSYAPGDQAQTAYNEGVRTVGLWLKTMIEAARPGAFARLLLAEWIDAAGKKAGRKNTDDINNSGGKDD